MYDKDEDRFALVNPDKVYVCTIRNLLRYFPEIEGVLREKTWTIAELVDEKWEVRRDKHLETLKNKMTTKKKYINSTGMSPIITADPDELRSVTKSEEGWEKLIPYDMRVQARWR